MFKPFFNALILAAVLLISTAVQAGYISHSKQGNTVVVQGELNGEKRVFSLLAHHKAAVEVLFENSFHQTLPSYAIANSENTTLSISETKYALIVDTGYLRVVIDKASLALSYYQGDELLIAEESGFFANNGALGFRFKLTDDEQILGSGERILGMNRRGHKFPLYNKAHYGYTTESNQMYYGLPAVMSNKKYMVIFDNTARGELDIGATESHILSFQSVAGRSSYIVVAGASYPALIQNYVTLTGKQPMPPRWALGNFASRFGYHSEQEVRATANAFKDEDMPLDAIVLDLYWFGKDIQGHMGNLAWDRTAFPNPEKMIADLQEDGVNTVVITEPFILTTSNKWQAATDAGALVTQPTNSGEKTPYTFDFYFGNTGLIDVFNQQGQTWFKEAYKTLYKQGVTGWWGDLGEPEVHPDDVVHRLDDGTEASGAALHNVYGHQWAKMVFDNQQALAPNTRPMIMMRSGFVGSQRYGMIPWTGDVSRSWGGLKPQVELSLQMGLFGLAYTHSDLGGFAGGETFDAEMYTRWLQYGVFQPVYRPHAQEAIAPEPVFHDKVTKDIVREYIKLRYQLLPYNYTLAFENSTLGLPLMRPLFFEDELDPSLIAEKDTYLWGDAFLITPVTDPDVSEVEVNVPNGQWFDFWTDEKVSGGQQINYPVTLSTIPVLVRAGSFIPMIAPISSTQLYNSEKLSVHYYHDESIANATGHMYEDDGKSLNAISTKAYDLLEFDASFDKNNKLHSAQGNGANLSITLSKRGNGYKWAPLSRQMSFIVHQWPTQVVSVKVGEQTIPVVYSDRAMKLATQAAYWDKVTKQLTVMFDWSGADSQVLIN